MRESLQQRLKTVAPFVMLVVVASAPALATAIQGPTLPANDLEALLGLGQTEPQKTPQTLPGPRLAPVPRAQCGAGSRPLAGMQGRLTREAIESPEAARGWTCNLTEVGHHPTPGGFRVWRYTDRRGRSCAYYDTSLSSPANVASVAGGPSPGVVVLDMSDPSHPRETDRLTSAAMLAPHESLNLNTRRGLLAAEVGNGLTLPGSMAIYDVRDDCRRPELQAQMPTVTGHESGFSPDGKTFWVAGGAGYIKAIDVADPKQPKEIWSGAYYSHGLSLSDDGNTLFQTDPINGSLGVLDVSEVQARRASPRVRERERLTWSTVSVPQNSEPLRIDGKPYLLEFDEFAFRFNPATAENKVGGARLIDMSRPSAPRVASNLRLEINMPAAHLAAEGDPTPLPPNKSFGYSAHYCAVPRRVDPGIVACSFLNSGLRVFDIRVPTQPREVAYFVAPPKAGTVAGLGAGNLAFSQPAFDPKRRTVFYTDAGSGFYGLRLSASAWPDAGAPVCLARRSPIGPRNIGRVRLGYTRARMRRLAVRAPQRTGRRFRFCVKASHGAVTAVFPGRSTRATARLLTTTARGHGNRRVRVGSSAARFRRAYPRRVRLAKGLYRLGRQSRRIAGLRAGRVRFFGVTSGSLVRRPAALRRYVRVP